MLFAPFISLLLGSLVSGQAEYPNLPVYHLDTTDPVTPLPQGSPWGTRTAFDTNAYLSTEEDPPFTGVIRKYDFTIARGKKAPDGYLKDVMLINGQFPGPLMEANWGDTIQVTVRNKITAPPEGTAIHWHGVLQKDTPYMDGVPGVSQCPIPPGGVFTYSFIADLYGTSWYHSHYSAQYVGGLFGPMVIHGPKTVPYDIDLGPIMLTDYYHKEYYNLVEDIVAQDVNDIIRTTSDNNLINGRNNFPCDKVVPGDKTKCKNDAGTSSFRFTPGKVHRLRLINAGGEGIQKFSIDGHNMTVIANDYVPVKPYETQVVTLGSGQRTDVLVKGLPAGITASYTMRSSVHEACSLISGVSPNATATVYYKRGTPSNSTAWPAFFQSLPICENDDLRITEPLYPIKSDPVSTATHVYDFNVRPNATGWWEWTVNDQAYRANYNNPVLLLSNVGNTSYPNHPEWNILNTGSNSSIRIIFTSSFEASHPMHLHGHNFQVLASGTGTWDGKIVRPENPQRRDTHIMPPAGYMVVQFETDNPGV